MIHLKRLFSTHPLIFSLLGIAIIFDLVLSLTGVMSSMMPGTSFALGSTMVIAYFLGVSAVLRFGIARKPIHLALTWLVMIFLYLGWIAIQTALQDGQYRPSMLFFLCVVAAFKTMRFRDAPTTAADAPPELEKRDETP